MYFNTNNMNKCDICGSNKFNSKSFSPILEVCSKSCLDELFKICKKIRIKDKHLKKILLEPPFKTKKLRKKISDKNRVKKKILNFEIQSRKCDLDMYNNSFCKE